ncbi:MAG: hypothetical protein IPL78_36480, partial [Chloroflexi bacterium]|nr:hypothetical protein [Chloroflexota bacterium]
MPQIRLSAIQFATSDDVEANLATCLRMIDAAASHHPHLIVTPEFINHILWFDDADHCWRVSVDPDGPFLRALGDKAREHALYLKVNVTLRRPNHTVTGSNILFAPSGEIVAITDKQILMGNENNFLTPATEPAEIITTPFGKLGMYCCMDGVIPEPARALAVGGAHILLNSLNSFAHDEASLHIPVRSGENKVFVVAANKVGGLVPPPMAQIVADRLKIPASAVAGAGESQILAPDGTVLAKAPRTGEAVIFADVELAEAENKRRPDGTDILASRRPDLYHPLAAPPSPRRPITASPHLEVAVGQLAGPDRVAEAVGLVHAAAIPIPLSPRPARTVLPARGHPPTPCRISDHRPATRAGPFGLPHRHHHRRGQGACGDFVGPRGDFIAPTPTAPLRPPSLDRAIWGAGAGARFTLGAAGSGRGWGRHLPGGVPAGGLAGCGRGSCAHSRAGAVGDADGLSGTRRREPDESGGGDRTISPR